MALIDLFEKQIGGRKLAIVILQRHISYKNIGLCFCFTFSFGVTRTCWCYDVKNVSWGCCCCQVTQIVKEQPKRLGRATHSQGNLSQTLTLKPHRCNIRRENPKQAWWSGLWERSSRWIWGQELKPDHLEAEETVAAFSEYGMSVANRGIIEGIQTFNVSDADMDVKPISQVICTLTFVSIILGRMESCRNFDFSSQAHIF